MLRLDQHLVSIQSQMRIIHQTPLTHIILLSSYHIIIKTIHILIIIDIVGNVTMRLDVLEWNLVDIVVN